MTSTGFMIEDKKQNVWIAKGEEGFEGVLQERAQPGRLEQILTYQPRIQQPDYLHQTRIDNK